MRPARPDHRTALTRPEVLTLLTILVLALTVGVSFVERVHESARRIRCSNNLRQVGIACHNCNDTYGYLPPYRGGPATTLAPDNDFASPGNCGSFFYFLMRFVEANSPYPFGYYASSKGSGFSVYTTLPSLPLAPGSIMVPKGPGILTDPPTPPVLGQLPYNVYQCPADWTMSPSGTQRATCWGASSYACNYLVFGNPHATETSHPSIDNPDNYESQATPPHEPAVFSPSIPASFPHGTSRTLIVGEKLSTCQWFMGGDASVAQPGGNLWALPGANASYAPAIAMESPWRDSTRFQVNPRPQQCNTAYASTGHRGGMPILTADASARAHS
jgi:hypothetical protein